MPPTRATPRRTQRRFPGSVRDAMLSGGSSATCLPVRLDDGPLEAALFLRLDGPAARNDRRLLKRWTGALPLGMETDLIATATGGVVMLRAEVSLGPSEPLAFEILLTPGLGGTHFETLDLLSSQAELTWFFGDDSFAVLRTQRHPLAAEQHAVFAALKRDATAHDAMVRLTGHYDARAALSEVVSRYALRPD